MKVISLLLVSACHALSVGDWITQRNSHYIYLTTNSVETQIKTLNITDQQSVETELIRNPNELGFIESEQICVSNTLICLVFTVLAFSAACSVVVAN